MKLLVFPTSRALREYKKDFASSNVFLPKLLTIDEFEKRAVFVKGRSFIDDDTRVILLKKASDFKEFKKIDFSDDFSIFLKNSSFLFRFFEELSLEKVELEDIEKYDLYAEFYEHINTLKILKKRYIEELEKRAFFDKITLPALYDINTIFLKNFEKIEIFLEGFLTRYELELFDKISKITELIINFKTNRYNKKMQERFKELGFDLKENYLYEINLSKKKLNIKDKLNYNFEISVFKTSSKSLQTFFIKKKIYDFINEKIDPEKIAVILPDESFKNQLELFDDINNLNFAMGFDFKKSRVYKALKIFENLTNEPVKESFEIEKFGLKDIVLKHKDKLFEKIGFEEFEEIVKDFYIFADKEEKDIIEEELKDFKFIYPYLNEYPFKKRLHLFLNRLSEKKIEDKRGGKITVLGVLESRGVKFDGVIAVDFNEGIVPRPSEKDLFLDSSLKKRASLPTKKDRENLQKYYYYELFRNAKKVAVSYVENDTDSKSRFLEELNAKIENFNEEDIKEHFLKEFNYIKREDEIILDYDFKKEVVSSTKLKDFLECKRRYYYRYIKELKSFDIPVIFPKENEIGEILHEAFLKIYKYKKTYQDIEQLKSEFKKRVFELIKDKNLFYRLNISIWIEKLDTLFENEIKRFNEGFFIYELEQWRNSSFMGFNITGKIDRIDYNGEFYQIIDYKSGKVDNSIKKDISKVTDFQLAFYYLLTKDLENVEGAYYYDLNDGKLKKELQIDEKIEFLKEIFDSFKNTHIEFNKCENSNYCRFCPYKIICDR